MNTHGEGMKTCTKCKIAKELSEFSKYRKSKDGYQWWCKLCQNAKRREAWPAYYARHGKQRNVENKLKQKARRELIAKMKDRPCVDCSQTYPSYVMDFDHLGDKKFLLCGSGNRNWDKVLEEAKKCDIVCANCHRIRTHSRKIGA